MTPSLNNYVDKKIKNSFLLMIQIEMELSGKSFDECKEIVKQYLKTI